MKMNQLPAFTFAKLDLNFAEPDYEPGKTKEIKITESSVINFNEASDVKLKITAEENKEISVFALFTAKDTLYLKADLEAKKSSKIKLVEIDASLNEGRLISDVRGECKEDAKIELVQVFPGLGDIYSDCTIELTGDRSFFESRTSYLSRKGKKTDLNYVANHRGKDTLSEIHADGILKDGAEKTCRQTVNFISGAAGSKGHETEHVLLLGDDIVNKSVPLILCTEEDVEGTHGVALGSLDDEMLFYLESRGIGREDAEKLIINATFNKLLRYIDDEETKEKTEHLLEEVLA